MSTVFYFESIEASNSCDRKRKLFLSELVRGYHIIVCRLFFLFFNICLHVNEVFKFIVSTSEFRMECGKFVCV